MKTSKIVLQNMIDNSDFLIRMKAQLESEQPYLKPLSLMIGVKPEPIGEIFGMKVYINSKLAEDEVIMANEAEVLKILNKI